MGFQQANAKNGSRLLVKPRRLVRARYFGVSDGHDSEDPKQSTADMTAFVQNLLQQMQIRFQTMSDSIISKIDDMGNRINELEQSINDLRAEMGGESTPSPSAPAKPKEEESSKEEGSA